MVAKRCISIFVLSKAFVRLIVIFIVGLAFPVAGAFYPKVIIRIPCQVAVPVARFQYALRQYYAGRHTILIHLAFSSRFVHFYVLVRGVLMYRVSASFSPLCLLSAQLSLVCMA